MRTSIATVSLGGTLREKLEAVAAFMEALEGTGFGAPNGPIRPAAEARLSRLPVVPRR